MHRGGFEIDDHLSVRSLLLFNDEILLSVVVHVVPGLFLGEIDLALDSRNRVYSYIKWIGIQEVNSRMRRSSGQRSPLRQPVKLGRPLRRIF